MRNDTLFLILTFLHPFDLVFLDLHSVISPGSLEDLVTNTQMRTTIKPQIRSQLALTPHGAQWSDRHHGFRIPHHQERRTD
jgi:hypothetical protein